jgi:CRISPR-associated protein Cas2
MLVRFDHVRPPGSKIMLRLTAYDIADPKRLHRVAQTCLDFGVRVQKSLFECWLDEPDFLRLWQELGNLLDPAVDRVVAYTLDKAAADARLASGKTMAVTERPVVYLF